MALTKEDITQIRTAVREDTQEIVTAIVNKSVDAAVETLAQATKAGFDAVDKRFDVLEADVAILKTDMGSVKRLVNQHSVEIMDLKARTA